MRKDFALSELDGEFLQSTGLEWETVIENGVMRVIVYGFPVPLGYNLSTVDLNVRIERGYPDSQIDMVYFHPHLSRADGRPIPALANDQFDGRAWQRWSRHRTGQNPWRPGVDYLGTHLGLVTSWLERELKKR